MEGVNNEEDLQALFESLQGEVSPEQWEMYKELKRVGEGLICSDGSDISEDELEDSPGKPSSSRSSSNLEKGIEKMAIDQANVSSGGEEDSEDESKQSPQPWEENLTVKYLDGEITFDDFTKIMEKHNVDEDKQSDKEVSGAETETREGAGVTTEKSVSAGDQFEEDFQEFKKKRKMKRRGQLPKDLQGLMGEANLCFARGDKEDAVKMCMEVIRLAPRAAEPFQTLAMIYEEMGDMEKTFQFSLIGAYLNPNNVEEWVKIALMCLDRGNLRMAASCYTNAIRCDNKNINLIWRRCTIYEELGEKKNAVRGYEAILNQLEPEQYELAIQLCRVIAKIYNESGDVRSAIKVMEKTGPKCAEYFTPEDVNILVELQMNEKMFLSGIQTICFYCGVNFDEIKPDNINEETLKTATKCNVPENLPIDLQSKLAVCLIRLNLFNLALEVATPIYKESPEEMGDLFLDIAEAYMEMKGYKDALAILEILIKTNNYNLAAVWLRYGECLHALSRLEDAVKAYRTVIEMAPLHFEARKVLSDILTELGKFDEAIFALKQDYVEGDSDGLIIDGKLLMKQCILLYDHGKWDEFRNRVKLLFTCNCYPVTTPMEYMICISNLKCKGRLESLREIANTIDSSSGHPKFVNTEFDWEELWAFYRKTWQKLYDLKAYDELEIISIRQLTNKLLHKINAIVKDIEFMAFLACYYAQKMDSAYILIKNFAFKQLESNQIWNLLCQIVSYNQDVRHNRFCLRLMLKHQEHKALSLFNGHTALVVGSYKHALGEYMYLYNEYSDDPLLTFCIGLSFMQLAIQKFSTKKSSLVAQGLAFLKRYWMLRGECQEVYYNLGRAMHGMGLPTLAIFYYKKALSLPPADGEVMGTLDLCREISYNLSLIYQASGSDDLARYYIQKYCVV